MNQRKTFANELYKAMKKDRKIWCLTADLGYVMLDDIKKDFPDRFLNVGASEQALIGIGIGLALQGQIPFCYSITPFLLYRPFEAIRNYINHESIPVKLIGSGRDQDYQQDGFTHQAEEDKEMMGIFSNIKAYWPETEDEVVKLTKEAIETNKPYYINLTKQI